MAQILVVDDDPHICAVVRRTLTRQGHEVEEALDAEEAGRRLAAGDFALLLADIRLPGSSGLELMAEARRQDPDLAVIVVSGLDDPEYGRRAAELGACGYLVKPFLPNELIVGVQSALHRRKLETALRASSEELRQQVAARTQALMASEERFRSLVETMAEGLGMVDRDWNFTYVNERLCGLLGLAPQAMLGRPLIAFLTPAAAKAYREQMRRRALGEETPYETTFLAKDGREVHTLVAPRALWTAEGVFDGAFGVFTDITERKRSEEALRKSQARLKLIMDGVTVGLAIIDASTGRVADVNPLFLRMLGAERRELLGKPCRDLFHDDCDRRCPLRNPGAATENQETTLRRVGGSSLPVLRTVAPLELEGRPHVLVTVTDISDRKRMESQLLQAQKLEAIGQLAAGIAHEVNTPTQYVSDNTRFLQDAFGDLLELLAAADSLAGEVEKAGEPGRAAAAYRGKAESIELDYLRGEIPVSLEQSLAGLKQIAKIVLSMKQFAHPDGGGRAPADLNQAIENAINVSRNEWKYVAEVETSLDPSLPPVPVVISEFNQVVLNLLVNAAQAISEVVDKNAARKGHITVATLRRRDSVEVSVTDDGPGVPEAIQKRVFEPFFTTKEPGKGTGQGLAIAHSAVERHGGHLVLESAPGRGARFSFTLPLDPGRE